MVLLSERMPCCGRWLDLAAHPDPALNEWLDPVRDRIVQDCPSCGEQLPDPREVMA